MIEDLLAHIIDETAQHIDIDDISAVRELEDRIHWLVQTNRHLWDDPLEAEETLRRQLEVKLLEASDLVYA